MDVDLRDMAHRARTLLFVPGDRPDRFEKASNSGADLVILDLEDGVPSNRKHEARVHVREWLARGYGCGVRVSPAGTADWRADLQIVSDHTCVVLLAKCTSHQDVRDLAAWLPPDSPVIAMIETATGVISAPHIASEPAVTRLALGNFDLAFELGVDAGDRTAMAAARSALTLASAAARIGAPVDGVTGAIDDTEALLSDLAHARAMGFGGKLCIHPRQVPIAAQAWQPSSEEITWAQGILAATDGDGATAVDRHMVDRPVVERARRIISGLA